VRELREVIDAQMRPMMSKCFALCNDAPGDFRAELRRAFQQDFPQRQREAARDA